MTSQEMKPLLRSLVQECHAPKAWRSFFEHYESSLRKLRLTSKRHQLDETHFFPAVGTFAFGWNHKLGQKRKNFKTSNVSTNLLHDLHSQIHHRSKVQGHWMLPCKQTHCWHRFSNKHAVSSFKSKIQGTAKPWKFFLLKAMAKTTCLKALPNSPPRFNTNQAKVDEPGIRIMWAHVSLENPNRVVGAFAIPPQWPSEIPWTKFRKNLRCLCLILHVFMFACPLFPSLLVATFDILLSSRSTASGEFAKTPQPKAPRTTESCPPQHSKEIWQKGNIRWSLQYLYLYTY